MLPPADVAASAVIGLTCMFDVHNGLLCPPLTVGMQMIVNDESQLVSMLFSLDHNSTDETLTHPNPIQSDPIEGTQRNEPNS